MIERARDPSRRIGGERKRLRGGARLACNDHQRLGRVEPSERRRNRLRIRGVTDANLQPLGD